MRNEFPKPEKPIPSGVKNIEGKVLTNPSGKKEGYPWTLDTEEVSLCLNALYDSGVKNYMFALISKAIKIAIFAIKTPNGPTKKATIEWNYPSRYFESFSLKQHGW